MQMNEWKTTGMTDLTQALGSKRQTTCQVLLLLFVKKKRVWRSSKSQVNALFPIHIRQADICSDARGDV